MSGFLYFSTFKKTKYETSLHLIAAFNSKFRFFPICSYEA